MKKSGSYLSSCSPPTKRIRPSCTRVFVCPNRSNDQIGCIELSDVDLFGFALFHAARAFLACSSLTNPLRASVVATLNSQNVFLVRSAFWVPTCTILGSRSPVPFEATLERVAFSG